MKLHSKLHLRGMLCGINFSFFAFIVFGGKGSLHPCQQNADKMRNFKVPWVYLKMSSLGGDFLNEK